MISQRNRTIVFRDMPPPTAGRKPHTGHLVG
jgi:hypothetical protein